MSPSFGISVHARSHTDRCFPTFARNEKIAYKPRGFPGKGTDETAVRVVALKTFPVRQRENIFFWTTLEHVVSETFSMRTVGHTCIYLYIYTVVKRLFVRNTRTPTQARPEIRGDTRSRTSAFHLLHVYMPRTSVDVGNSRNRYRPRKPSNSRVRSKDVIKVMKY